MRTIGQAVKEVRTRKRYSRKRLEEETKIKKDFIEAIEKEEWSKLPEYPVVQGFVKRIATTLKANPREVVALLRRDYPPQKLVISPKPDVSEKFTWSPKLTFITGVVVVIMIVLGYLGFQYLRFTSPPPLEIYQPQEGQVIAGRDFAVSGKTDPQAVVKVNNQLVLVGGDGFFTAEIEIFEGTEEIEVKAISRSGKETVIRRKIVPELAE